MSNIYHFSFNILKLKVNLIHISKQPKLNFFRKLQSQIKSYQLDFTLYFKEFFVYLIGQVLEDQFALVELDWVVGVLFLVFDVVGGAGFAFGFHFD